MMKLYSLFVMVICVFCLNIFSVRADDTHTVLTLKNNSDQPQQLIAEIRSDEKLKAYPNPVSKGGLLTIEIPSNRTDLTLFLYNTVGKVVQTFKITDQKMEFNVPDISGIYLLRFVEKQKVVAVEKIVVRE